MSEAPLTFRTNDDFVVSITSGKATKEIKIPRLLFKNAKKVLSVISKTIADDMAGTMEAMSKASKASFLSKEGLADYTLFIKTLIPKLTDSKNYQVVEDILIAISEGCITKGMVDDMQYDEAVKLTVFLIERNFESLKNLTASLAAINTSAKSA